MSANLLPQTPVIKDWLADATRRLTSAGIPNAHLDAEVILAYTLREDRTYLHAHAEKIIDAQLCELANSRLDLRLDRVPIAYIIGYKEFYGRQFMVTPATLIPRPESETIIDVLSDILGKIPGYQNLRFKLIDVGTGSGILGITAKLEFPDLNVTLSDISNHALKVARKNAKRLSAKVTVMQGDLLQKYALKPDIIIANLPYVNRTWQRSPETEHEPALALFAENDGKATIEKLITQASSSLAPDGYLILEADPSQHDSLIEFAVNQSFEPIQITGYVVALQLRYVK